MSMCVCGGRGGGGEERAQITLGGAGVKNGLYAAWSKALCGDVHNPIHGETGGCRSLKSSRPLLSYTEASGRSHR